MNNLGLFENAVRSLLLAFKPEICHVRMMIAFLDLLVVSDMENYDYSDRLVLAIHSTKTIFKAYIQDKENNDD